MYFKEDNAVLVYLPPPIHKKDRASAEESNEYNFRSSKIAISISMNIHSHTHLRVHAD